MGAGGAAPAWLPVLLRALLQRERHHKCVSGALHLLALAAAPQPAQRAPPGASTAGGANGTPAAPALRAPGAREDSSGAAAAAAAAGAAGAASAPGPLSVAAGAGPTTHLPGARGMGSGAAVAAPVAGAAGAAAALIPPGAAPPAGWRALLEQLEGARHADVRARALLGLGAALPPLVATLRQARLPSEPGIARGWHGAGEQAAEGGPAGSSDGHGMAGAAEEARAGGLDPRTDSNGMCSRRLYANSSQGRDEAQPALPRDAAFALDAGLEGGGCGRAGLRAETCREGLGSGSGSAAGGRPLPSVDLRAGATGQADALAAVAALLRAARRCGEPAAPREVREAAVGALAASGLLLELPAPASGRATGRGASPACKANGGAAAGAAEPGNVTGVMYEDGRAGAPGCSRVLEEAAVEAWAAMLALMEDDEEEVRDSSCPRSCRLGRNSAQRPAEQRRVAEYLNWIISSCSQAHHAQ